MTQHNWKNIFFNREFKTNAIHLFFASLVINLLALAMPIMMLQAYDRILPNHGIGTLSLLVCGVFTAIALEMLLRIARSYLTAWSGAVFEVHPANEYF